MKYLHLLASLGFVLSPLASDGFNGFTPSQFPVVEAHWPIQPVGWAFSIWGVIYLGLLVQALVGLKRDDWAPMRGPLTLSLGLGMFWIAVANIRPAVAAAMIVYMAAAAIVALLRAPRQALALVPLGLYAGWLTAATGVAFAVVLSGYGVMSGQAAALLILPLSIAIAARVLWLRAVPAFGFGVCWALMGIIIANHAPLNLPVIAIAGAGLIGLAALSARRAA